MLKKLFKFFLVLVLVIALLNFPATTRQGINGRLYVIKIPLYIKLFEFFDRSYWYAAISRQITKGSAGAEEKVKALFNWVTENIRRQPEGFDVIDDHALSIIIRRYGTPDQISDVFTTLCIYSGIPAFWYSRKTEYAGRTATFTISYVLLDGKWRIFDPYHKRFFMNTSGEITSVDDIISDIGIVKGENLEFKGIPYDKFFENLKPVNKNFISKEEKQVPLFRLLYEAKRLFFGPEKHVQYEENP